MKLGAKIKFGVNAIVAGQKSTTTNAEPQLIVNSTPGKFVITSAVSKALGVAVGENVMFLNNLSGVEMAIQNKSEEIVAYATENGIDLNTREGIDKIIDTFGQWFIAKGVLQYDSKGNPIMSSVRMTKEEKANWLKEHGLEVVEENREALISQYGELSDEEFVEKLTVEMVESPKYHAASGSKTSTSGTATGIGCQLSFTDSNIWNALKADLGNVKETKNRIFDVAVDEAETIKYNNGMENVEVTMLPIYFKEDVNPIVRTKKDADYAENLNSSEA